MEKETKVICRKCGKLTPAQRLVLDTVSKITICPSCAKEQEAKTKKEEELKQKPVGWDFEDEYLDRVQKQKDRINVVFERLDRERIRYTCFKCGYKFIYNTIKRYPQICPYCSAKVLTFKFQ